MGDMPAPKIDDAVNIMKDAIYAHYANQISLVYFEKVAREAYNKVTMNGTELGSLAGWSAVQQPKVMAYAVEKLNRFVLKKRQLKGTILSLALLNSLYFDIVRRNFAPGGRDMLHAWAHFEYARQTLV